LPYNAERSAPDAALQGWNHTEPRTPDARHEQGGTYEPVTTHVCSIVALTLRASARDGAKRHRQDRPDPADDGPVRLDRRQIEAAAQLYMRRTATVAGKKIELIVKDDTGTADITKRSRRRLVNDKVAVLAGFG
jgi:hypothetical protein